MNIKIKNNLRQEVSRKIFLIIPALFIILFLTSFIVAETDGSTLIGKQNNCIDLPQECADCTYVKLTTITFPDISKINIQTDMTQNGTSFNYTFCNTSQLGSYSYCTKGDVGATDTSVCKDFQITGNGKQSPDGIVIVLFMIAFIIIIAFTIYEIFMMFTHVFLLDYDAIDFAKACGTYFAILALNLLQTNYLGNPDIQGWFSLFINVGLWTNVIVPAFSLTFTLTVGSWIKIQRINKMNQ